MFFNGFDIPLSHVIYAASEMFLVPSIFEPCGLTQLVAMRYGSVPIVRKVGGLLDTVVDEASSTLHATGFCFKEEVPETKTMQKDEAVEQCLKVIRRALGVYDNTPRWAQLVHNGMARDSSWEIPAAQYVKLYHEAVRQCVQSSFFASEDAMPVGRSPLTL